MNDQSLFISLRIILATLPILPCSDDSGNDPKWEREIAIFSIITYFTSNSQKTKFPATWDILVAFHSNITPQSTYFRLYSFITGANIGANSYGYHVMEGCSYYSETNSRKERRSLKIRQPTYRAGRYRRENYDTGAIDFRFFLSVLLQLPA